MPQPRDYRATRAAANKIEPVIARAFVESVQVLKRSISINELAMAIASGKVRAAYKLLPVEMVRALMAPVAEIIEETVMVGGELGAVAVNEAVKR